jgi:Family of unknown function (DUF5686)/CarboxypepD_reg-like domain
LFIYLQKLGKKYPNFMKLRLLFILPFFIPQLLFAQNIINGRVLDARTHEPLPFVNIMLKNTTIGTTTDGEGKFEIKTKKSANELIIRYLGYEMLTIKAIANMEIMLQEARQELAEVTIRFNNPAHRIIENAIKNKPQNDPEKLTSFTYKAYIKGVITTNGKAADSSTKRLRKIAKRLKDSELYVNESLVNRQFMNPNLSKETIVASRTSGAKNSTILATTNLLLQPFSFYADFITFQGRRIQEIMRFVNPITKGSTKLYDFYLADTLINAHDSTFVIEFTPQKGRNFSGLKGVIHINSEDFAIEYVEAEPAEKSLLLSVKMEQTYEKTQGKWFPAELFSEWILPEFKIGNTNLVYRISTKIQEPQLNLLLKSSDFDENSVVIDADATFKKGTFWQENRTDSLTIREKNTFEYYQKINPFKRFYAMASVNLAEWFLAGAIPLGRYLDLSTQNLFDANIYEGTRPTLNVLTSPNFSKLVRLDGKLGYGFNDQAWKYEGRVRLHFNELQSTKLSFSYRYDISEPSNVQYFIWNFPQIPYELVRTFLISRADWLNQYKAELNFRALKHGTFSLSFTDETRSPSYDYMFLKNNDIAMRKSFHISEAGVGLRWAYGEKFAQIGRGSIITDVPSPVISIHAAHGFMDFLGGQFDYMKVNAKIEFTQKSPRFGETYVSLSAGKTWGDLPYPYLYNGRGSKAGIFTPIIWTANHFNTMGLYEFVSDQYLNVFLTHNFKNLLFKPRVAWFRPEISIINAFAIGSLRNPENHKGVEIKTLEKGYFETGLTIDNIYRQKVGKLFYLGGGVGTFYRWGANRLPNQEDNLTYRLVWNIGF